MKKIKTAVFKNLTIDIILLLLIVAVGWFLIGWYVEGEYLAAGYQDWIYHAWRIKSLDIHGKVASWDHIWSNGLSHWRAYQYLQHWFVLIFSQVFHIAIPKAMLVVTVCFFIILRVVIYIFLRMLRVNPVIAFFATIVSFVYAQQWITISDFSIFLALIIVPFWLYIWINVFGKYKISKNINMQNMAIAEGALAIISGSLWIIHPVIATTVGGLFFMSIGIRAIKVRFRYFIGILSCYTIGASPFFAIYFLTGYHFGRPIFTTAVFMKDTIVGDFFGLSGYFVGVICFLWLALLVASKKIPAWAYVLVAYATGYFLVIYLAQNNYMPKIVMQLQISRAVPILSLFFVFAIGGVLNAILRSTRGKSIGITIGLMVFSIIGVTKAIELATVYTWQPVHSMDNPVAMYFNDKSTPSGSIYVKNVSAASFFGDSNLRFVTSYNEHLLPHPLSVRFSSFMRSEIAYTGVPSAQLELINEYALVLGVEYLVLPKNSPLVDGLIYNSEKASTFEFVENITTREGVFSVLRNKKAINYVYLVDANSDSLSWSKLIGTPTLHASSYAKWDAEIHNLASNIKSGNIEVFSALEFVDMDRLFIPIDDIERLSGRKILIAQSYDNGWYLNGSNKVINSTKSRFITIDPNDISNSELIMHGDRKGIMLQHKWPSWHWPLQIMGIILTGGIIGIAIVRPRIFIKDKF